MAWSLRSVGEAARYAADRMQDAARTLVVTGDPLAAELRLGTAEGFQARFVAERRNRPANMVVRAARELLL